MGYENRLFFQVSAGSSSPASLLAKWVSSTASASASLSSRGPWWPCGRACGNSCASRAASSATGSPFAAAAPAPFARWPESWRAPASLFSHTHTPLQLPDCCQHPRESGCGMNSARSVSLPDEALHPGTEPGRVFLLCRELGTAAQQDTEGPISVWTCADSPSLSLSLPALLSCYFTDEQCTRPSFGTGKGCNRSLSPVLTIPGGREKERGTNELPVSVPPAGLPPPPPRAGLWSCFQKGRVPGTRTQNSLGQQEDEKQSARCREKEDGLVYLSTIRRCSFSRTEPLEAMGADAYQSKNNSVERRTASAGRGAPADAAFVLFSSVRERSKPHLIKLTQRG